MTNVGRANVLILLHDQRDIDQFPEFWVDNVGAFVNKPIKVKGLWKYSRNIIGLESEDNTAKEKNNHQQCSSKLF